MFTRKHMLSGVLASLIAVSGFSETIYVTNTNSSGAGSLRDAIVAANANPSFTNILFNIPGTSGSERIINVSTPLPAFSTPVEVKTDAAQSGQTVLVAPTITGPGQAFTAFVFDAGSGSSVVETLVFRKFAFGIDLKAPLITIANNFFENNQGGVDIRLYSSSGSTIRGNNFTGTAYAVSGESNGIFLLSNTFNGESVAIGNSSGVTIGSSLQPNFFSNISSNALMLSQVNGGIIRNNIFSSIGGQGIVLENGIDNIIESNVLTSTTGWEVYAHGGHSNKFSSNIIFNSGTFNGLLLQNGLSYTVNNNNIQGGSIELTEVNGSSNYGPVKVISNSVIRDSLGFSGHGAIMLTNLSNALVQSNTLQDNLGNGVYLNNASNVTVVLNNIQNNGRTGVYVLGGQSVKISRNTIWLNKSHIYGTRSGIVPNNTKSAPSITSVKRVGNSVVITGSGTVANDTVEIFRSDYASANVALQQDAYLYIGSVKATGSTWSITVPSNSGDYFNATATDTNNNTSTFSLAKAVEINGATSVARNTTYTYATGLIPGVTYQWWVNADATVTAGQGTNIVDITFGSSFSSGSIFVGFTHPVSGWTVYQLNVTGGALKTGSIGLATVSAEAYPNPFHSTTRIKLDATLGENATINLYDSKGNLIHRSEGHAQGEEVELGNALHPGLYMVHVIAGEEKQVLRIIKSE